MNLGQIIRSPTPCPSSTSRPPTCCWGGTIRTRHNATSLDSSRPNTPSLAKDGIRLRTMDKTDDRGPGRPQPSAPREGGRRRCQRAPDRRESGEDPGSCPRRRKTIAHTHVQLIQGDGPGSSPEEARGFGNPSPAHGPGDPKGGATWSTTMARFASGTPTGRSSTTRCRPDEYQRVIGEAVEHLTPT